ncbi:MAG: succinylglutamate desuccinylase/aspartoacylase family protein [Candidatus Marinimicrobia bacterium]|nr:succinylglutamate desuccinylase/aspartoacylase family protein [Candidatus Neomarinimicrobiota bacterium]
MIRKIILFSFLIAFFNIILAKHPRREHKVYYKNTRNELNVYKLYGEKDGNTVLIIGGIQGDEPGGYLSADLYSELMLRKGNLIVVPRTNFHSIIKKRRYINWDMNRRFNVEPGDSYEDKIVKIISNLMDDSDLVLNLHDGWGFYSDKWEGPGRNPKRFGQSIIADAEQYVFKGDTIHLKKMAMEAIKNANQHITNSYHKLHFMNTRTLDKSSKFPQMKNSATYYALTRLGIPAFGIEASKNIDNLEDKIRYHNYAINAFLEIMDVVPEFPSVIISPAQLQYIHISINNQRPVYVKNHDTLYVYPGDKIKITRISSNYKRGVICDVVGIGTEQDFDHEIKITRDNKIRVQKDAETIGTIYIRLKNIEEDKITYVFQNGGKKISILSGQTALLKQNTRFKLLNVYSPDFNGENLQVNIKGFVPPVDLNRGEDRNYWLSSQDMWSKYSIDGRGKKYPIVVENNGVTISKAYIEFYE